MRRNTSVSQTSPSEKPTTTGTLLRKVIIVGDKKAIKTIEFDNFYLKQSSNVDEIVVIRYRVS